MCFILNLKCNLLKEYKIKDPVKAAHAFTGSFLFMKRQDPVKINGKDFAILFAPGIYL